MSGAVRETRRVWKASQPRIASRESSSAGLMSAMMPQSAPEQDPCGFGGRALVVEDERDDADQSAFRQARLPENGGDEPQRRRDRPECAGHGRGAAVQHLDGDVHHQPDGREAEQDVHQHDGERRGKGVAAEDQEDACDESGIARRNKGGGAGGNAEGRAVTLVLQQRVREQTHLPGVREKPVVRVAGDHGQQGHQAPQQRQAEDDCERTARGPATR